MLICARATHPVPLSVTLCGLDGAELVNVNVMLRGPSVVGVNVNDRVADAPGAIAVLKAAHWNSLVAGAAGMFMVTGTSPVFVIVSVRVADAESGMSV